MSEAKFEESVCCFLKRVSHELSAEDPWRHMHLDIMHRSLSTEERLQILVETLSDLASSLDWDRQNHLLGVSIRLDDRDNLTINYPDRWEQVFVENVRSKEPPSVDIIFMPNLASPPPTGSRFLRRIDSGELYSSLLEAGLTEFYILYSTVPYDFGEPSEIWGRVLSIYLDKRCG